MKKLLVSIVLFFMLASSLMVNLALADDYGLDISAGIGKTKVLTTGGTLPERIGKLVGYALSFVGTIFFLLVVYGGFKWMTANGNEKDVTAAKDLIVQAIIGIVIIFSAYILTQFIGKAIT